MLGKTLRQHREDAGYSVTDAAGILGINHSFLSRVEHGERTPSLKLLREICDLYQLDTFYRLDLLALMGFPIDLSDNQTTALLLRERDALRARLVELQRARSRRTVYHEGKYRMIEGKASPFRPEFY